jgi:hypothetical protein
MTEKRSFHEDLARSLPATGPSDRAFGFWIAALLAIIGFAPVRTGRSPRYPILAAAVVFATLAVGPAVLLRPVNVAWTRFGILLGRVVNPAVMFLLFLAVVTPMAVVLRLLRRDPLHLGRDARSSSYWLQRIPPGPEPHNMRKQF